MSDLFISYKRENLQQVQPLVQALRANGVEVWWDQDIAPDAPWEATIERELAAAKAVIVAWSQVSVTSENVKAEARRARTQGKLIQVFVEKCETPLFFGERQGVDLTNWTGSASDSRFQAVLAAVRAVIAGKRPPEGVGYAPKQRAPWGVLTALFIGVSAVLGFVSNLGGARDAVCSIASVHQFCLDRGLITGDAANPAQIRARLLASVNGDWGRQDRNCADTVNYSVAHGADGFDRITATAPNFQTVSQVIAAENGVIVARDTAPSTTGAREQWEFHPDGDRLTVYDKDGVATTLVRCN